MLVLARLIVAVAVSVAFLPPEWCRALPTLAVECCDACADGHDCGEHHDSQQPRCQCGKLPMKQSDEPPALACLHPSPFDVADAVGIEACAEYPAPSIAVDFQQTLCRWRC